MPMEWSGNGTQGYVIADDKGRPVKVICSYGTGSYESGAEYAVEEVVFCPLTQRTVRENCGEAVFPQLMAELANRKTPEGMYALPDAAKSAFSSGNPDWKAIHKGDGRILFRHLRGAMAWVHSNGKNAAGGPAFVEGLDAQALDVEFSYFFPEEEKTRIEKGLAKGANGVKAMEKLFGKPLAGVQLLSEKIIPYNQQKRQEWRVADRGVLHVEMNGKGKIESIELRERGEAYIVILGLSRF